MWPVLSSLKHTFLCTDWEMTLEQNNHLLLLNSRQPQAQEVMDVTLRCYNKVYGLPLKVGQHPPPSLNIDAVNQRIPTNL